MGRVTVHQRVYDLLVVKDGPTALSTLVVELQAPYKSVQSALQRMRLTGVVQKHSNTGVASAWSVSRGAKRPEDGRGRMPGSEEARRIYGGSCVGKPSVNSLRNLKNVRFDDNGNVIPKLRTKHALEQAWGWFASPVVGNAGD